MNPDAQSSSCERVRHVAARVGDRWSARALLALLERPLRFNELLRAVHGVSQRMLTFTLRNLERDGLIGHGAVNAQSPQPHYELTAAGRSLCDILLALCEWGEQHSEALTVSTER